MNSFVTWCRCNLGHPRSNKYPTHFCVGSIVYVPYTKYDVPYTNYFRNAPQIISFLHESNLLTEGTWEKGSLLKGGEMCKEHGNT